MLFARAHNPYRLIGDGSHVVATWILLFKLIHTRSASGISGKSQLLFALTYTFRYLDLLTNYVSDYNTVMKCYYIFVSWLACYLIWSNFTKKTYEKDKDTFRIELLIVVVSFLAFFLNHETSYMEIAWTWSIYMESVALLPQLHMIWKTRKTDRYILLYVLAMALYRGMYIANWVYRYYNEDYYDLIAIISGCVEALVGFLGFLIIATISLENRPNAEKGTPSIYVLPSVVEQFGKDYKILRNTYSYSSVSSPSPTQSNLNNLNDINPVAVPDPSSVQADNLNNGEQRNKV